MRLPLRLGRQSRTGPARERVRLVVADVATGSRLDRPAARQRELQSRPIRQYSGPATIATGRPAVGQPQLRARIAAVAMNSRNSPLVTSRSASRTAAGKTRCRGARCRSEPPRLAPISRTPAPKRASASLTRRRRREGGARYQVQRVLPNACFMSVSSSSWCCCSWCTPSSSVEAAPRRRPRCRQPATARRRQGRYSRNSSTVGRDRSPRRRG